MISVIEGYQDCVDRINPQENGVFTYAMYNRFAWLAQLRMLEWLSGDVSGVVPPEPYRTQKNRDWLAPFVVKYSANATDGFITRPSNYYLYQDLYLLRGETSDCDDGEEVLVENIPVTLLSNDKFYKRANTFINGLKPTQDKAIVKQVGRNFEFLPSDIGSVNLEYIRYPLKSFLATKIDTTINDEVPDLPNCIDFEWDEYAREILVWFIVAYFSMNTRETALFNVNLETGKTVREGK